jgi:molecular chaperone DnaJ
MAEKDFYTILGISKDANEKDIKAAYRKLAMKYHPDRNANDKDAEEKFKDVQKAYAILSDPQKKAAYDRFGHAGVDPSAGGHGGFGGQGFGGFGDIFEDLFENIFTGSRGGQGGRNRAQAGADLQYNIQLTLEEAATGNTIEINVPKHVACHTCSGSGAKPGTTPKKCGTCDGIGQVRIQQGFFSIQQTCPNCHGEGTMIQDPCTSCRGQGRVREEKKLSVKIPAGVDTGDRVRLAQEGEAGYHGGPAGDLYVAINLKKHPIFERHGSDLHCEIPIDFVTAAIGGSIEVPTLNGPVSLKIPEETQTDKVFRLRGKGIKSVRSSAVGDLLCKIIVETPINLSKEQKNILEQFQKALLESKKNHAPKNKGWLDTVKKFFEGIKF